MCSGFFRGSGCESKEVLRAVGFLSWPLTKINCAWELSSVIAIWLRFTKEWINCRLVDYWTCFMCVKLYFTYAWTNFICFLLQTCKVQNICCYLAKSGLSRFCGKKGWRCLFTDVFSGSSTTCAVKPELSKVFKHCLHVVLFK